MGATPAVNAPVKLKPAISKSNVWKFAAIVAGLGALFALTTNRNRVEDDRRQRTEATARLPVEMQLATLDGVSRDQLQVARIRSLLSQLATTFAIETTAVADMSYVAQQSMLKAGIREPIVDILEAINQAAIFRRANDSYAEYIASYEVLRTKGFASKDAVESLQDIGRTTGLHSIMPK